MSGHWLAPIMAIFESPSDDLVDLARAAGYDPRTFYEGTLSKQQIANLLFEKSESEKQGLSVSVSGDLGTASAYFPEGFRKLTAPVRVFSDEMALQEAYYSGEIDHDLVAVLLSSAHGERHLHHIQHLTTILQLMHHHGREVVVLIDMSVTDLRSTIPVVANFMETSSRKGAIGQLSDGDIVTVNARSATIKVVENADRKQRRHRSLTIGSGRRFLNEQYGEESPDFEQAFERYIVEQTRTLVEMDRALDRPPVKSDAPFHLRAFSNFCFSMQDVLRYASSKADLAILPLSNTYDHLVDLLDSWVKAAKRARSYRIALRGSSLAFELLRIQGLEHSKAWSSRFVRYHMERGNLNAAIGETDTAISDYRFALSILDEVRPSGRIDNMTMMSRVKLKLGVQYEKLGEFGEALHFYDEAVRDATLALQVQGTNPAAMDLAARTGLALAELRYRLGDFSAAIDACDEALRKLGIAYSDRPSGALAGRLATTFSLKADMLVRMGEAAGSVLARIAAIHFRQAQANQSRVFRQSHVDTLVAEVNRLRENMPSARASARLLEEQRAVIDAAREVLDGLDPSADFSNWLYGIERLKAGARDHLPDMIRDSRFYFD